VAAHKIARTNEFVGHAETLDEVLFIHTLDVALPADHLQ
jgi:hypothetical protein